MKRSTPHSELIKTSMETETTTRSEFLNEGQATALLLMIVVNDPSRKFNKQSNVVIRLISPDDACYNLHRQSITMSVKKQIR